MYEYMICNEPDEMLFEKQCAALERHIPGLHEERQLEDVDGSHTRIYRKDGARILVHNSYYRRALFVESEIELEHYFKK